MAKKEMLIYAIWVFVANFAGDLKVYCRDFGFLSFTHFLSIILLAGVLGAGWLVSQYFPKEQ